MVGVSTGRNADPSRAADIVLAEYGSQAWLVRGEQHIDDLLANTLPPEVSIQIVACESKNGVERLYLDNGGEDASELWLIHPGVVNRAKGQTGTLTVQFAEWSAKMDDRAEEAMRTALDMLNHDASTILTLTVSEAESGNAMAADLQRLRTGLLQARLVSLGATAERLRVQTASAAADAAADCITLVVSPP